MNYYVNLPKIGNMKIKKKENRNFSKIELKKPQKKDSCKLSHICPKLDCITREEDTIKILKALINNKKSNKLLKSKTKDTLFLAKNIPSTQSQKNHFVKAKLNCRKKMIEPKIVKKETLVNESTKDISPLNSSIHKNLNLVQKIKMHRRKDLNSFKTIGEKQNKSRDKSKNRDLLEIFK